MLRNLAEKGLVTVIGDAQVSLFIL